LKDADAEEDEDADEDVDMSSMRWLSECQFDLV